MKQDVAAYYEQTQNHYRRWWQLDKGMSLHYGLWTDKTKSFLEALGATNEYMAMLAGIREDDRVLDAGCGVGGAAIFLARHYHARVVGLSLSEKQVITACENARQHGVAERVSFQVADFTETDFTDGSFDVIWACESSSSAPEKSKMIKEWNRLLKPNGKLVLLDFFKTSNKVADPNHWLDRWTEIWAMSPLPSTAEFTRLLESENFKILQLNNLTNKVVPTIKLMYRSYLLGRFPAKLYNLLFGARQYSRNHYKSGLYQYRAYQEGLWQYGAFLAEKK